jgi:hypothetical protein
MWWNEYYSRQSVGTAEHVLGMIKSGFVVPALGQKIAASSRGNFRVSNLSFLYF